MSEQIFTNMQRRLAESGRMITGVLGGAVLAVFLFASNEALAYEQVRAKEKDQTVSWTYNLPSYPHEARRMQGAGYDGVRYTICMTDGTATGIEWSDFIASIFKNRSLRKGKDYPRICGLVAEAKSRGRFSKWYEFNWFHMDDDEREGDEYYWIELSNPEVKRPGSSTWQSTSGSHHVPATIKFQIIIQDDD